MSFRRKPDFIGNYMLPDDLEQQKIREEGARISKEKYEYLCREGCGTFFMFITTRKKRKGLEKIAGTIIDNWDGEEATFDGEINEDHIKFTKKYLNHGIKPHLSKEIPYEGKRMGMEGIFEGTYKMKEEGGEGIWQGKFILLNKSVIETTIEDFFFKFQKN